MHPRSGTPAHNDQILYRCQGSQIFWTNDLSISRDAPELQNLKLPTITPVPPNKEEL